jgi:thymidylate synthase
MSEVGIVLTQTVGECWLSCMEKVLLNGLAHYDEDIEIREILGLAVNISHPLYEDQKIFEIGNEVVIAKTFEKFSKDAEIQNRPFTYGSLIFDNGGIDQFEWVINRLNSKRETKSATFGLLTPGNHSPNLPCLTTIDIKIRHERLELQFFFRSQNIFGRQYANLLALAKLQHDIAKRCSVKVGHMKGYIASAHIYQFDLVDAQRIVSGDLFKIQDKYYELGPKSIRMNNI